MYNCIFSGHCVEPQCDASCPILAQTSYLLERNGIQMNNSVFKMDSASLARYRDALDKSAGTVATFIDNATVLAADCLTYCAICNNWKGSQLHCTVYNLRFSQYIEAIQKSWSYNSSDSELDYIKIWALSAKILVISNIDFVNFKEFQCQTLLSLLQSRMNPDMTTIVVSPPTNTLVGDGQFFARLVDMLNRNKVV